MKRRVEQEWLDELPVADPRTAGARQDLQRLNAWMGNVGTMVQGLRAALDGQVPRRLVELGAGDGRFLLQVARRLHRQWPGTSVALLDRQPADWQGICQAFAGLGWRAEFLQVDVLDWLRQPGAPRGDAMVANLFLHHFPDAQLEALLREATERAQAFVAVEPRRSAWSFLLSRCVGLLGCNRITRHDAPVSVRAGFTGRELTRLWPAPGSWSLQEGPAGWCSHLFVARRKVQPP